MVECGSTSTTTWSIPTILFTSAICTTITPNVSDTSSHVSYYTAKETATRTVLYWYLTCHRARDWWCLCGDTDKSRSAGRKSSTSVSSDCCSPDAAICCSDG